MGQKKGIEPLLIPVMGILPLIAFFICDWWFSFYVALGAGLSVYVIYLVILFILKQQLPYSFLLTTFVFILSVLFSFINPFKVLYTNYSSIVFELFIVLVYASFNLTKGYFRKKTEIKGSINKDRMLVTFDFDVYVIRAVLYILIFHLLLILTYKLFPPVYQTASMDQFVYFDLFLTFILLFLIYEFILIFFLQKSLEKEEWLPIIDEKGGVHGKIAASVSREMKNKFLHPVVRVALIYKGCIFLKGEKAPGGNIYLDYPFKSNVVFRETLEDALKKAFVNNGGDENLPYRFIFKYTFKNEEVNRLVYLYSCHIVDEKMLSRIDMRGGKWWTSKQIEENLGTGIFSECFEKEYELLNSTILMADRLLENKESSN